MEGRVSRGHRTYQWVAVSNRLVATRETLEETHGVQSPIPLSERRRTSPTWGSTPRMPVCSVAACPRRHQ